MLKSLESCADFASRLVGLLESPPADRDKAAKEILIALASLYAAALSLPWPSEISEEQELEHEYPVSEDERRTVYSNLARVFGDHRLYWLRFDPIYPRDDSEAPVCADLADDLTDIWADVKPALTAWKKGRKDRLADITWDWRATPFESHWGVHAAHALHALHFLVFDHGVGPLPDRGET